MNSNELRQIEHFVVAGATWLNDGLKYRRHRLCEYLAGQPITARVFYVAPYSLGFRHLYRNLLIYKNNLQKLPNGIWQIILPDRRGNVRYGGILEWLVKSIIKKNLSSKNKRILWYTNPSYPVLGESYDWDKVVYDCSDLWNRDDTGKLKYYSEKRIIERSNIIFATSGILRERVYQIGMKDAYVVENGVDYERFAQPQSAQLESVPKPRMGYIGGLKFKIDYELLVYLADNLPDVSIVLIGPDTGRDNVLISELLKRKNVCMFGSIPYEDVPGYMKALDVGILPYKNIEYNKAVSPLKLFEYLAAGIPTVGTGIPTTEKYSREGVYYYSNGNYEDFLQKCTLALEQKNDAAYIEKRLEVASMHDWNRKFEYMLDIVYDRVNADTNYTLEK